MTFAIQCWECGEELGDPFADLFPECGGLLNVRIDLSPLYDLDPFDLKGPLGVWRYSPFMPVSEKNAIRLQEGGTPLYDCRALAEEMDMNEIKVKYEGANPTGSFKDRGMTLGVSRAVELGVDMVGCASTGNTSASLAAYAAKAGIRCTVLLPEGKVAAGKLAQAMFYGADIVSIDGSFDDALKMVKELSARGYLYLLNSINPFRLEGQKSLGFEIMEQLGFQMPEAIILPVGNAGNIWAVYKALREWEAVGWIDEVPRLIGVQAEGANPIVSAFKEGRKDFVPVEEPETVATAIRIGDPVSGKKALYAIHETGGLALDVSDEEIMDAQRLLGRREGIGVEPASAASIAGLKKLREEGMMDRDEKVVCICTGNLLKDPDAITRGFEGMKRASPNVDSVLEAIRRG